MKFNIRKRFLAAVIGASFLLILAGCSNKNTIDMDKQDNNTDSGQNAADVQTIKVGTGNTFKPYAFIDEDGELKGFEIDFLNEVDKRLETYEFKYESMDLTNLVLSLESGKIDMISYQLGKNPEREEKFLFPQTSYINSGVKVTVKGDNESILSLDDLRGRSLSMNPSEISNDIINEYNNVNKDNPIKVIYRDGNTDGVVLVAADKVDATLAQPSQVIIKQQEAGMNVKTVGELLQKIPVYQLFRKDDAMKGVMKEFDRAVKDMLVDGTISELSIKWMEEDYTK